MKHFALKLIAAIAAIPSAAFIVGWGGSSNLFLLRLAILGFIMWRLWKRYGNQTLTL